MLGRKAAAMALCVANPVEQKEETRHSATANDAVRASCLPSATTVTSSSVLRQCTVLCLAEMHVVETLHFLTPRGTGRAGGGTQREK